jgi:hypothetical protein
VLFRGAEATRLILKCKSRSRSCKSKAEADSFALRAAE